MAKDFYFIKKWKNENLAKIKLVHPEWDEEKIESYLVKVINEKFVDKKAIISNSYKGEEANTSLLNLSQFIHDYKPITAGYGVLYKQHEDSANPLAGMLMESITDRNYFKNERKKYDKRSYDFLQYDIAQGNAKVICNSVYGACGAKTSIFYNRDIASSVTATGQAEISTAETSLEALVANNVKFFDIDECMLYISRILSEDYKTSVPDIDNIEEIFYEYILNQHMYPQSVDTKLLKKICNNLTKEDMIKIYLKNNMIEFFKYHQNTKKLLHKLINLTTTFRDPNKVPSEIEPDLEKLWEYVKEFVVYDYPVRNRIERDKYHKRKACVTQDTDSTMVTLYNIINFLVDNYADDEVAAENENEFEFILVNIVSFILTKYCRLFLNRYCKDVNIKEDKYWMINMKNEFFYPIMVLTEAKKHYLTLTKLQEGKEINPPKIESHGLEFGKSETSQHTKEFFEEIIKNDIMFAEEINVSKVLRKLKHFEEEIVDSLRRGETKYLNLKSVKEPEAYDKPYSEQGVRAARNWNFLFPDMQINLPEKFLLLKLSTKKQSILDKFKDELGDKYHEIKHGTFDNANWDISKNGFDVIGIPQNVDKIPDFLIPLIDFATVTDDNVGKFNSILKSLGAIALKTRSSDEHMSNLIDL